MNTLERVSTLASLVVRHAGAYGDLIADDIGTARSGDRVIWVVQAADGMEEVGTAARRVNAVARATVESSLLSAQCAALWSTIGGAFDAAFKCSHYTAELQTVVSTQRDSVLTAVH